MGSFGKLYSTPLDGYAYAEPLVATGVFIAAGPNTLSGAGAAHDVVYTATEHDSIYAVDSKSGQVLWKRSFLDLNVPTNNTLGAVNIMPVPGFAVFSSDINPEIGITGTPVIDAASGTMYVSVETWEFIGSNWNIVQRLHAINISDGTDRVAPFLISQTVNDTTINTPIYVYGSGDGAVTDPYNGTGRPVVRFNAVRQNQRSALRLVNGTVYVSWASHGDAGPYHGWVVAWDVSNLAGKGLVLKGVFNDSPNGGEAGIWGGGGGPGFEANGSAFYVESGNGPGGHGNPSFDANGFPVDGNYYESLIKVVADPTTSATNQNKNGWGMKVADFFIPYNQVAMDNADRDFGSAAPMLLPDSAGIAGHPHLLIAGGKDGKVYVVDRDNLGKFDPNNDHVVNAVPNSTGNNTPLAILDGDTSTAAFYNGSLYLTNAYNSYSNAYRLNPNGTLTLTSQSPEGNFGYVPGSVIVSSNGNFNGIAWAVDRGANQLHAYDAGSLANELWNSGQKSGGADNVGVVVKFAVPTEANGEIFIGTSNALVAYGLTPPAGQAPNAPVLAATALSGTSANLTWTDNTAAPNLATNYLIEQSSNGSNFTQVTTAPAGAVAISIGGLSPNATYYFRIRGQNSVNPSAYSNVATATTSGTGTQAPNAPSALGAAPATATSVNLTWTNNASNQTGFRLDRATDANFTAGLLTQILPAAPNSYTDTAAGLVPGSKFYYRIRAFNGAGDSLNSNPAAVTIPLAPPTPANGAVTGVTSTSIGLSWTDNAGTSATGYVVLRRTGNGVFVTAANLPPTGLGNTYTWTDIGLTPGTAYEYHIQAVNTSGNNDFTGANATTITAAPTNLTAAGTGNAINLSWNAVAAAVQYNVYRGTNSGGESATPVAVGVTGTTFLDTAVAAGPRYYYTVTAFNSNINHVPAIPAESAWSNEASANVSTVAGPTPPTSLFSSATTANSVAVSWIQSSDPVGVTGYNVFRNGSKIGTVPGNQTYLVDTGLTAGTTYTYTVTAFNAAGGTSAASAPFVVTTTGSTVPGPTPPTNLFSSATTANSVAVSWIQSNDPVGVTGYNVFRNGAKIGTVPGNQTYLVDTGLTAGTTYTYTVTAFNAAGGISATSAPFAVTTTGSTVPGPTPPTSLFSSATTANSVAVSWLQSSDPVGVTGYYVYRNSVLIGTVAGNFTYLVDYPLTPGATYTYTVSAFNAAGGISALSAPFVVTTAAH